MRMTVSEPGTLLRDTVEMWRAPNWPVTVRLTPLVGAPGPSPQPPQASTKASAATAIGTLRVLSLTARRCCYLVTVTVASARM
jgi:hypothetical protein